MLRIVFILVWAASILVCVARLHARDQKRPLTVKDSIEAAKFLYPYGANPVLISPNGKNYLVIIQWGDSVRNGSRIELLSGSTVSFGAARDTNVVARLFSKSTASTDELVKNVRWMDDSEQVTFLWDDGLRPRRVVSVDVRNHVIQTLAQYVSPIAEYDISRDGRTIVFTAQSQHDTVRELSLERQGFTVSNQSIWALLEGDFDGWSPLQHYDTFVLSRPGGALFRIREAQATWSTRPELLRVSPDGRYAITVRPVVAVPPEWDGYTEHIFKDDYLPAARHDPNGANLIRQYFIIDIKNRTARPLWNAPENPPAKVVWSPDSRSLVIGPTFLPLPSEDSAGLAAHALVEVDRESGHYVPLPNDARATQYGPTRWREDGVLELSGVGEQSRNSGPLRFKKVEGQWMPVFAASVDEEKAPKVRIELREDFNTPPALYAIDSMTHAEELIQDPNPQLKNLTLGRVELVHWKANDGRSWSGALYYPVHFQLGHKFPLVIQTHGYSVNRFQLDGAFTTIFAAQALANRDIAVLQLGDPDDGAADVDISPNEPQVYMAGFEGAIKYLAAVGIVNHAKVGIIGFSRTGWYVEYMLTHSRYPLAAAEVADNIDCSYFQYVLSDGAARSEFEADHGARPIGDGLEAWVRSATGFNADKIQTPLRMEIDTGPLTSILRDWEIFSNLRYLQAPVELFVIPDIRHGVHLLQNPAQRLASQGGTVDWFCFWLKNETDSDPAKAPEYDRWRMLKRATER